MDFSVLFISSYLLLIVPTALVIISAVLSAKSLGGTLGQGLKKIAVGTIVDTILLMTYLLIAQGNWGILDRTEVGLFFMFSGLFGSIFLISGYVQVYRISKKLKLFTP